MRLVLFFLIVLFLECVYFLARLAVLWCASVACVPVLLCLFCLWCVTSVVVFCVLSVCVYVMCVVAAWREYVCLFWWSWSCVLRLLVGVAAAWFLGCRCAAGVSLLSSLPSPPIYVTSHHLKNKKKPRVLQPAPALLPQKPVVREKEENDLGCCVPIDPVCTLRPNLAPRRTAGAAKKLVRQ